MGSKIFWLMILVVLCVGGYFMYDHYHQEKMMGNGDVTWDSGQPSPEEHAAFLKENAGETPDGQSERKIRTASAGTDTARVEPAARNESAAVITAPPAAPAGPEVRTETAPGVYTAASGGMATNLPASDSILPNPANGARFAGSGSYQWYRQGNLTWRVDTVSGHSCIDYATMEEWHKPIVSSHGCGRGA